MPEDETNRDEETLVQWEREDYLFRHNYYRVEQAAKRLESHQGSFSLSLNLDEEGRLSSLFETPDQDAAMEFALAMSKFLIDGATHSIDAYLSYLKEVAGDGHEEFHEQAQEHLEKVRAGHIDFKLNGERLSAERAYQIIAKNVIFANDTDAAEFISQHEENPVLLQLLQKLYHDYCLDAWKLLTWIHAYRHEHGLFPPQVDHDPHCIYCKSTEGDFKHVEHTIPESLGNEHSFLPRGFVCGTCKQKLDDLEEGLHKKIPFSTLLPFTRLGNKKGKLPAAKFPEVHIEKKSPNQLRFKSQLDRSPFREEKRGDMIKLSWDAKGRFDAHKIARILSKAALGAIALERGRDHALDPKYDRVREYITEGGTFPNKLAVFKENVPSKGIEVRWMELDGATACDFTVLGVRFLVVLNDEPVMDPHDILKPHIILLDLSLEHPEKSPESWDEP